MHSAKKPTSAVRLFTSQFNSEKCAAADTLRALSAAMTHFVGRDLPTDDERFRVFVQILDERWLRASYREQLGAGMAMRSDGRTKLSSNEAVISTTSELVALDVADLQRLLTVVCTARASEPLIRDASLIVKNYTPKTPKILHM